MIRVVCAVFIIGNRVLACRRSPHKALAGKWEFPGGKIEPNETSTKALAREILEELGEEIEVFELLNVSTTNLDGVEIQLECYHCTFVNSPALKSADHDEMIWVEFSKLQYLDWAEADLAMVAQLTKSTA